MSKVANSDKAQPATCGLVMPISAHDGCTTEHWLEVKSIITESICSINQPKFEIKLVSDGDEINIIHKRIVENLYSNDLIVCDISGRNANVMFELGLRLAFDRATVIIKDDATPFSFDTSPIEHVVYPRDLRFSKIVEFKETLSEKALHTYHASKSNEFSQFLRTFNNISPKIIDRKEISGQDYIIESLNKIQSDIELIRLEQKSSRIRAISAQSNSRSVSDLPSKIVFDINNEIIRNISGSNNGAKNLLNDISYFADYLSGKFNLRKYNVSNAEIAIYVENCLSNANFIKNGELSSESQP